MSHESRRVQAVSMVLVFGSGLILVGLAPGLASANHGPQDANATFKPFDRTPGATAVKYGQTAVMTPGYDLETFTRMLGVYEAGSFENCGPTSSEVLGIDRGNSLDGYEIDEELTDNVKSFSAGEDEFEVTFYGEDDFGASTHLNDGDELVSVTKCIDNPDTPGWYRIAGTTEGVNQAGEEVSYGGVSHYFWICTCDNEAEARKQLGPPPSEPAVTPTPTATEPGGDAAATATNAGGDAAATRTPTRSDASDVTPTGPAVTPVVTATRTRASASTSTPSPTGTPPESWDSVVVRTPTVGSGPGFGSGAALAALCCAAVLISRRV